MRQSLSPPEVLNAEQQLKDKHALIFGGTSGIGLATALQAKAAGARVTVVGLDRDRARSVAEENGFADWRAASVTDSEAIRAALSNIGTVDHLVLLAGSFALAKVLEADISLLRLAYEERIWSIVHILRALGDKLAQDASITLVSGALTPDGNGIAIISSACTAVEVLGRGLALELAPRRVNTLSPGPVDTPLLYRAVGDARTAYVEATEAQYPIASAPPKKPPLRRSSS